MVLAGKVKQAARFHQRSGSGLFFLARKTGEPSAEFLKI